MKLALELTDEQVDAIAEAVAEKMRGCAAEVLTVEQAARKSQVSVATVRRWVRAGRLPKINSGRTIRIPAKAIDRLLLADA